MTRKRSAKPKAEKPQKVEFQGFLQIKLNKQEKQYVKDNLLGPDAIMALIMDAAFIGYKISVSHSPKLDTYFVTAYGNRVGHPDAGWALSIRHSDFVTGCTALRWCLDEAGKNGSLAEWLGNEDDDDW